jgi:hypothetical protein
MTSTKSKLKLPHDTMVYSTDKCDHTPDGAFHLKETHSSCGWLCRAGAVRLSNHKSKEVMHKLANGKHSEMKDCH